MNIFGIDDTLNGLKRGAEKFGTRVAAAVVKKMKTRVNGFSPKEPEPYGLGMGGSDTEQMSQPAKNGGPGSGPQPGGGSSGEPGKYKGKDIKKQGDKFIVDQPMRQVGMSYDGPFDTIEEAQKSVDAEAAALEERKRRGFTNNIPHAKLRQQNKLDFLLKELPLASEAEEKRIIQAEIESLQKELSEFPPSGDPDARREKDSSTGGGRDSKLNASESPEDLCDRCPHKRGSHGGSTCGACAAGSRSEKTHDFVLKGSPEGAHGRGELGNEDSANLGYQSAQKTTTAQADALSKCPACGYESPEGWDGKCDACGVENSEDVGGNEAKKENANSRCIKCDKSLPIEQMVQNEHGAGYLCPEDAKAWNVENSDAGTMREAIVSRYSGELQSGNIGPACKDAIVKLAEQIGSSAQQVLKDLRSDASVLSNETENGHGATCSQCNKWTDDAFMGPDGKLICKACVKKENAVDPSCQCDHSNYFEASCDCEDRGCKCPECATLQAELKNAAGDYAWDTGSPERRKAWLKLAGVSDMSLASREWAELKDKAGVLQALMDASTQPGMSDVMKNASRQFNPGDMVTIVLSDGNKEARFVKYDTNYGDGDEVVTVEVRGTIGGQLFKKNEQFQEHQLRKNSLHNSEETCPECGVDLTQHDHRKSCALNEKQNAAHLAPDAWEVMDCDSRRQWLIASGSDPEQADWRFSDLSEDVKKALSNEFDKMEIGAASNGVMDRHNASGQMKTFVFKDAQGEAEEIHAADEASAWDQLAKNFATPLSDVKGMGIKLDSVRENDAPKCPECGGALKYVKSGVYPAGSAECAACDQVWEKDQIKNEARNSVDIGTYRGFKMIQVSADHYTAKDSKGNVASANSADWLKLAIDESIEANALENSGDFTINEAREELATVVREEKAKGRNPKDIVAMLRDNRSLREMAEAVWHGNEFNWQHEIESLNNADTAGDLEEIERHAEGIEHEIAELKVGGIQNSGLKRGLKYGAKI